MTVLDFLQFLGQRPDLGRVFARRQLAGVYGCRPDNPEAKEPGLRCYLALEQADRDLQRINALGGVARCNNVLATGKWKDDKEKAAPYHRQFRQALEEIKALLPALDETERQRWQGWLTTAGKRIEPAPAATPTVPPSEPGTATPR
jgi:hypothetical protein